MSETCTFEVESIKDTTLHASLRLCHPDEVFLWVSPAAIACLLQQLSERFGQKKTAQSLRKAGFFFDQEAGDEEELASLNLAATDFISSVRFGKVLHAREADARPGESLRLERDESGEDPEVKLVIRVKDARLLEGLEEGQRIDTVQSAMGPLPSEEAAKKPPAKPSTKKAKDTAVSIEGCGGRSDRVAITTDGSLVAIAAFGGPRVVVARTGDGSRASFELKAEVADVAFLGSDVVVAWRHKNTFGISIHDTTGKQLAKTKPVKIPSTGNVGRCVVSPNEELVAVSTSGEQTFLWKTAELRAGKPGRLFEVGAGGKAAPIGFSGSNEVLVALGENRAWQSF